MFIYLNHSDLSGKGILSFFLSKQFTLEIHGKEITTLNLSAVYKHIGIVREVLQDKFILKLYEKTVLLEIITIWLKDIPFLDEKDESRAVKINNSLCSGKFFIYKFRFDGFTDLERLFIKNPITFLSKSVGNRRMTYTNEYYTTDSLFLFKEREKVSRLPFGWERKIVNNQLVYVDHNTKTTSLYLFKRNFLSDMSISTFFHTKIIVDRNDVLNSILIEILEKGLLLSDSELVINFKDEIGDGVGVTRDFFRIVSEELKKDKRLESVDGFYDLNKNFKFKKQEDINFLKLLGIILGMCVLNKCTMNIKFSLLFLESITNLNFTIDKIQDTAVQKTFLKIKRKEISIEEAKEYFCLEDDKEIEKDLDTFINFLLVKTFYSPQKESYRMIEKYFNTFLRKEITSYELFYLIYIPELSLEELFKLIYLQNCSLDTNEIKYLKEILQDDFLRLKFVIFVTGECSVNYDDAITIEQLDYLNMYFIASTCNKVIRIGKYNSKSEMEKIFLESVENIEFRIV